jgi:hypothetical protein
VSGLDASGPPLVALAGSLVLELLDSVRVFLLAISSHIVELPFVWTADNTLAGSESLRSGWAFLVDEGWGDLLTVALSVVGFTSLEGWLEVEFTTEDISLGSGLELTEPEHHLVDVGGEGQVRWINELEWSDGLDEDTLWTGGKHLEHESVLTVLLDTLGLGEVVDESWFAGLLLALVSLWVVDESLIGTFLLLADLGRLVVDVGLVSALV